MHGGKSQSAVKIGGEVEISKRLVVSQDDSKLSITIETVET